LYFTSRTDSSKHGLYDLEHTLDTSIPNVMEYIPPQTDERNKIDITSRNLDLVDIVYSSLLLIRLLSLKTFLEAALRTHEAVDISTNLKKTWLELQLGCSSYIDFDYCQLRDELVGLSPAQASTIIGDGIAQTMKEISNILPCDPLFVALDQAEFAADKLKYAFWQNGEYYSVLKAIISIWTRRFEVAKVPFAFVVAGTEIPFVYYNDPCEWGSWVWSSNTGVFDDEGRYGQYVLRYLPPTLECRERLVKYMWARLRGRYARTCVC